MKPPMRSGSSLFVLFSLFALAIPLLVGCQSGAAGASARGTPESAAPPGGAPTPPARQPEAQASAQPPAERREATPSDETYPSSLYLERDVNVTARADGVIEKVLVDRGQAVRASQALALLETDLATRDVEIAELDLRLALSDHERAHSLHEQNIISPQEFQRSEIARDRAQSRLGLAREKLERCTVKAPFDGIIVERMVVLGERIKEDDSTPLFRLVGPDPLRARVYVPEERLKGLPVGTKARLEVAGEREPVSARVVFQSPVIDPASGTAPVIVETTGPRGRLRPGTSVVVRFEKPAAGERAASREEGP